MEIMKESVSGTLQSNDCLVRVLPGTEGVDLNLSSSVMKQFGDQIEKVIMETLIEMKVENCKIIVEDRGALDCTIKARVETAVNRSNE
ncbi:citrate lyase acyl carrier protein [Microaceticoccus formicicus]|uniref:citrate lyase acyl carrier protein n=1 Tax=Microaceticoccus formicicus TaxID=3118105 RepID=UPI003CCFFFB0|nr:citrate lyase acyl carrier protein [Peptoniphilaceae bacterium AMB_02]